LFVHESGTPGAPAVLLLHGAGLSHAMWEPQVRDLARFHLLAPDLPGHGKSPDAVFDLGDCVRRLTGIIQERAAGAKAHIVGLSLGGAVGLTLASVNPAAVESLFVSGTSTPLRRVLASLVRLNEPFLRILSPQQQAGLLLLQFRVPRTYRAQVREALGEFRPAALAGVIRALTEIQIPLDRVPRTLVAVGQRETFLAKRYARRIAQMVPGAAGVMVPGAGHLWNLESPELFSSAVESWITGRELPGRLIAL